MTSWYNSVPKQEDNAFEVTLPEGKHVQESAWALEITEIIRFGK